MPNLLAQAINCNDGDHAAKIIRDALGIESDHVVNYCFPTEWPTDRERRARYIGQWLKTEAALPRLVIEPRRFPPPGSVDDADINCRDQLSL
jgi:uncharacterized protein HemY